MIEITENDIFTSEGLSKYVVCNYAWVCIQSGSVQIELNFDSSGVWNLDSFGYSQRSVQILF